MKSDEMERKLVDSRTGIIHSLDKKYNEIVGLIPMQMISAYTTDTLDRESNVTAPTSAMSGLGYDFNSLDRAKERAIGESIERYCSLFLNNPVIKSKVKDIKNGINLLNITRCSEEQILNNNLHFKRISPDAEFNWVKGNDEMNQGEEKWIPIELVYLHGFDNPSPIREITSTGLAAGSTLFEAKVNGMLECIERDAFTIMWQNRLSMPIINHQSIKDNLIISILDQIEQMGLEVTILDITSDIGVPSYLTVIKGEDDPYTTYGASTDFYPNEALLSSIREASACYNLNVRAYLEGFNTRLKDTDFSNFSSFTEFHQHAALYAYQKNSEAIDFLFQGEVVDFQRDNSTHITNYHDLLQRLRNLGIEMYSVDITSSDIKKAGLHVARVIMPQVAFLEVSYPMLNCERIFNVPLKLGYSTNILNPYPHPFP